MDEEPEIVPEHLSNPVNVYLIGILIIGITIFVLYHMMTEDDVGVLAFIFSVGFAMTVAIFAFMVSKQNDRGILAKSYFLLGLGLPRML